MLFSFTFKRLFGQNCCRCIACRHELGTGLGLLCCPACQAPQPPPPTSPRPGCCPDYFRLFGLPARFDIPLDALKTAFRQLQAQAHPDRSRDGGAWSAWINRANETLRNPLSRAVYLIDRLECAKGLTATATVTDQETEITNENEEEASTEPDAATTTIAHVLEVRELLLDSATSAAEVSALKRENDARIGRVIGRLRLALDDAKDAALARRLVNELRYLQSIENAIKERL